jgi:hypothetical protein
MDDDLGEFGLVTFTLSDADADKPFYINNTAEGIGRIYTTEPLNFEAVPLYMLTVVVQDLADPPMTNESTVYVTVLNVNDHQPVFVGDGGIEIDTVSRRVLEETPHPYTVLALQVYAGG